MKRELHLNLFINSRGHHEASWRHPDASELDLTDVQYLQGLSQRAEEGLFDSIFLADQLSFRGGGAALSLEPLTALAALAEYPGQPARPSACLFARVAPGDGAAIGAF